MPAPIPTNVHYHKRACELELGYADGHSYRLSVEYLRVFSPSAEVRGHGRDTATLQVGKKFVGLKDITQAGRYALKLHFDDGHDSGLFSWDYLKWLIDNREANWADYLERLEAAGASREPLGIEIRQL
ncbi:gamma-butyrobetaine hydroxylase-like domain-containing protein [Halomonas sp. SSL-5]|uniref:gamma-butyrobetaine hydroxylase-like domain-containing protein n=1 Tax=Halomonas sp. SSL-5 TaxID=3065855 RepID=UPI0027384A03|nr:gamma-butyrobetaine hydroxylase-like domain-containing protein [Halomonas sp. SSL-5]MDY7117002.1 gamma-butyrobetaine hydroxylase-like domain-containing protein [Halomonas sp. SSL-5]